MDLCLKHKSILPINCSTELERGGGESLRRTAYGPCKRCMCVCLAPLPPPSQFSPLGCAPATSSPPWYRSGRAGRARAWVAGGGFGGGHRHEGDGGQLGGQTQDDLHPVAAERWSDSSRRPEGPQRFVSESLLELVWRLPGPPGSLPISEPICLVLRFCWATICCRALRAITSFFGLVCVERRRFTWQRMGCQSLGKENRGAQEMVEQNQIGRAHV